VVLHDLAVRLPTAAFRPQTSFGHDDVTQRDITQRILRSMMIVLLPTENFRA